MMVYDTNHARKMADRQIRRLGGRIGAIRRGPEGSTTDIRIMVAITLYTPQERRGELIQPTDRRAVISTFKPDGSDLGTVPDRETDQLVLYRKGTNTDEAVLRIVQPPTLYEPNGTLCLIECQVRK